MSSAGTAGALTGPSLFWSSRFLWEAVLGLALALGLLALVSASLLVVPLGFVKSERSCPSS